MNGELRLRVSSSASELSQVCRRAFFRRRSGFLPRGRFRGLENDIDHALPIDDPFAAGAADRCSRHFTPLFLTLLDADILGMQVYQTISSRSPICLCLACHLWKKVLDSNIRARLNPISMQQPTTTA